MSKHKFLKFILILLGIIAIYFYLFRDEFKEYNLKKSISACIMANKKISKSSNFEEVKKYCEDQIGKKK